MHRQQEHETEKMTGVVREVVFYNRENGYAVCALETSDDFVTAVGCMPGVAEGESVTLEGVWSFHQEYGPQLKVLRFDKNMPTEEADILKYLSSGTIRGVRMATAKKIVAYFGKDALNILASCPEKLSQIHGISPKKAREIGEEYARQMGVRTVMLFLQKFGIGPSCAVRIYKRYGVNAVDVIQENPYVLAEAVYGIGFKTADSIALQMGVALNAPVRIEAALCHLLWNATLSGHTFLPKDKLLEQATALIGCDAGEAEQCAGTLVFASKLVREQAADGERMYLSALYQAEVYTAAKLKKLAQVRHLTVDFDVEAVIAQVEREQHISLAEHQKSAVYCALENGVTVITGGPGTGKTTIINSIIRMMEQLGKSVLLAAPTGRAAKRMTEVCGMEAKTIHRLLESSYSDDRDHMQFMRDDENPLECDILIVDEMSMVDIFLIHALLKAVKAGTRLVLVGDSDQLPSVGAGYVLRDIIQSGVIPTVALTDIFRQAKESAIVVNAHRINHGALPKCNEPGSDFFLVRREHAADIASAIVELCCKRLPAAYGYNPTAQIQVLSPTRKGLTGVQELNAQLQAVLNPPAPHKRERRFKNRVLREGDKVMQIKNNYDLEWSRLEDGAEGTGVFNGDIGYVHHIDADGEEVAVVFDDRLCLYPYGLLDELELAYAVTVHKSQGSEFDVIVMPMYPCAPMLQTRNLLYTAVTRAKKLVVLVGRERSIAAMVQNIHEQTRYSGLGSKLAGEGQALA